MSMSGYASFQSNWLALNSTYASATKLEYFSNSGQNTSLKKLTKKPKRSLKTISNHLYCTDFLSTLNISSLSSAAAAAIQPSNKAMPNNLASIRQKLKEAKKTPLKYKSYI